MAHFDAEEDYVKNEGLDEIIGHIFCSWEGSGNNID